MRAAVPLAVLPLCARLHAQQLPAYADEIPLGFSIGPQVSVQHDSNFFRTSGLEPLYVPGLPVIEQNIPIVGVTQEKTDLVGSFHETYSRETVNATATLGRVLYRGEGAYDYTDQLLHFDVRSDLPFESSVTLSYDRSAQIARFSDLGSNIRDIIDIDSPAAQIDLPLSIDWHTIADATRSRMTNSATLYQVLNVDVRQIAAGLRYQPSSHNHVDLMALVTHGDYPNGSPSYYISPTYRDRGLDLRVDWAYSGVSRLVGHAGYLERRNDDLIVSYVDYFPFPHFAEIDLKRNFSGANYDLTYDWRLGGALDVVLFGQRLIGAAGDNNYLSAVTHSYSVKPVLAVTGKTSLALYFQGGLRNYFGNYAFLTQSPLGVTRADHTDSVGATLIWKPRAWLQASLDVHHDSQNSSISVWSFSDAVASLSVLATIH